MGITYYNDKYTGCYIVSKRKNKKDDSYGWMNGLYKILGPGIICGSNFLQFDKIDPGTRKLAECFVNPKISENNRAIIDWDKYQESNKDNIYQMLIGEDEDARQYALEVLRQHNCVLL